MEMDITKIHLEFEFKVDEVDRILIGNGDLTGIVGAQMSCVFFNFFVVLFGHADFESGFGGCESSELSDFLQSPFGE